MAWCQGAGDQRQGDRPVNVALARAYATYGRHVDRAVHSGFGEVESDDLVEPAGVASSAEASKTGRHTLVEALLPPGFGAAGQPDLHVFTNEP